MSSHCRAALVLKYSSAIFLLASMAAFAQEPYRTLHSFGAGSRAIAPEGVLTEGLDGLLYGVASGGLHGNGLLYRMAKDAAYGIQDIYHFLTKTKAFLTHGSDGRLYVITASDGLFSSGAIFRINPDGTQFEVIHDFGVQSDDGLQPAAALTESDGRLYGTTPPNRVSHAPPLAVRFSTHGSTYQNKIPASR
jgi:hypothetical protein